MPTEKILQTYTSNSLGISIRLLRLVDTESGQVRFAFIHRDLHSNELIERVEGLNHRAILDRFTRTLNSLK
jgi:hypothetical protein